MNKVEYQKEAAFLKNLNSVVEDSFKMFEEFEKVPKQNRYMLKVMDEQVK